MQVFIKVVVFCVFLLSLVAPFTFLKPVNSILLQQSAVDANKALPKMDTKHSNSKLNKPKAIEMPLHDVVLPSFAEINDIALKKKEFFDFIRPAVVKKNQQLLKSRQQLEYYLKKMTLGDDLTQEEEVVLQGLVKRYRVKPGATLNQIKTLMTRVDIIPVPLVLVQAANESAWGTSRFSRIGLNFFGIWCYEPDCGMVPTGRDTGAKHEVAAFDSVSDAVSGYFRNINTHSAYNTFRVIRAELRAHDLPLSPKILATGLLPYSERGSDYVIDITDMLRHNQKYFGYDKRTNVLAEQQENSL